MGRKKNSRDLPTFDQFIKPLLEALIDLGGSGSIEEINEKIYSLSKLTEEQLEIPHGEDGRTEIEYRLAWTRTYLKKAGFLENSARGIWALTNAQINPNDINVDSIVKSYRNASKNKSIKTTDEGKEEIQNEIKEELEDKDDWKEQLLNILYKISPSAFERLAQRLLRESGFFQVEVTGKSGDGGIDGKGIVRVSGLLSFHVIFQCKRYKGVVIPSQIRDFRGAMQGRADKGLFITTGTFTREAIKEATRDGAPPIDLIDGEILCDKLKELKLGLATKITELIEINADWFNTL
jgi:restriction system protein